MMGDGWETRRRRGGGNDWVIVELAARGHLTQAALDTSYFIGNSPGSARLWGIDATVADPDDPGAWFDLLPRTRLQRDTRYRFRIHASRPVSHVKLAIYPDGGLARLRLFGEPTPAGLATLVLRWFDLLPAAQAVQILITECGAAPAWARDVVEGRPLTDPDGLAKALERCEPRVAARVRDLVRQPPDRVDGRRRMDRRPARKERGTSARTDRGGQVQGVAADRGSGGRTAHRRAPAGGPPRVSRVRTGRRRR
ncbi:hypothetical protein GCM10009575_058640 [Streptomyces rhizosphaericus]|uniref:Allantoicase domain-containing protein n=2 Tax=Streptomyces TaxID=1883 RepID=A0ABN1QGQ7_9ACTN